MALRLRDRLAPPLMELLCAPFERLPVVVDGRRKLVAPAAGRVLELGRSDDPKVARRQDRWERPWGVIAWGCHPNRDTLPAIESYFEVAEVVRDRLTKGPSIVRPYVLGRAVRD